MVHWRAQWNEFKHWPPGERFEKFHQKHRDNGSRWARPLFLLGAFVSFAIGFVLVFIPGPAIVFFALTAALLATQSSWVAGHLDRAELQVRRTLRWLRAKRDRRRARRRRATGT
jgi:hypothetical protein